MSSRKYLIAIVGPTASGKSALGILLAERISGEIISADSRQIYKYLNIGTAKPIPKELQHISHHFINILNPDQDYSAGEYGKQARAKIIEVLAQGKQPILVGGSGLYVRAVIDGFFEGPGKNEEIREQLEAEARSLGVEALYEKLKQVDPDSASKMDATKIRRIIRALEVYYITGQPISRLHLLQETKPPFKFMQFGLEWKRQQLYDRINRRIDNMITTGLVEEVKDLLTRGYSRRINALNTVGYKEVFDYLEGKVSESEMIELIKRNTRRFAKRQLTWFRADKRIQWISVQEGMDWIAIMERIINKSKLTEKPF
jgi:tRNA dimethylallyltransferase